MIMGAFGMSEIIIILIVCLAAMILLILLPNWKIFGKAEFSPVLSLLMLVPLVNIIMLYYLAFADWPSLKQTQQ